MSTTSKHYDVVVLGADLGALAAAALLARRSWRVLVLGNGVRKPTYIYDGLVLARRPFTFLAASSPAWTRVLVELAQSQTFRRRLSALDPMLQVLGPDLRLDVPPDNSCLRARSTGSFPRCVAWSTTSMPTSRERTPPPMARSSAMRCGLPEVSGSVERRIR